MELLQKISNLIQSAGSTQQPSVEQPLLQFNPLTQRKTIACGSNHSVSLKNDGTIKTWGDNNFEQLNVTATDNGYIAVVCGSYHSVALKNDGTITAWGDNRFNQLLDTPTDNGYIAIVSSSVHSLALKNDGTITAWGDNRYDTLDGTPTDNGYIAIACGASHSTALKNDGTIRTWGNNDYKQIDDTPTDNSYITIACGASHSTALKNDGTITSWGDNEDNQLNGTPDDDGYIAIACGYSHSIALKNNGTIKSWGDNSEHQLNGTPQDYGYIAIACGRYHSVALKNDGTIKTWGDNNFEQLNGTPRNSGYIAIACGDYHSIALKNDGTIVTWGSNSENRLNNVPTDNNFMTEQSLQQFNFYQSLITNGTVQQSDRSIINIFYDSISRITRHSVIVNIDRNNIFESLKTHIRDKGGIFFAGGTYIKFTNEPGVDQGGLTREFFSLLTDELKQKYFITYDSGYSTLKNDPDTPNDINDYYLIGQMFAYAIKSKNNINIKLNPIILDFMTNSKEINKVDFTNSEYSILFDMFDNFSTENIKKILKMIQLEDIFTNRQHNRSYNLEEITKIFNDYEPNILGSHPYSVYLTLTEDKWNDTAKICLDEPGAICGDYMDTLDVPFNKKDIYLLFIIKSLAYSQYLAEFHKFLDGFNNIIKLDKLNMLSLKQLNKIIVGDRTLNIDDILSKLKIINAGNKESMVREIIREESGKNEEYLNKLVYLITGSESLPLNGFNDDEFRIDFTSVSQISSHTCDGFKYVEIPNTVLQGTDEEVIDSLSNILSYDSVVASGQSAYCMVGGSPYLVNQLKNFV